MTHRNHPIIDFSLNRPVTVSMVFLSLLTIGLIAGRLLPLEYFPDIDAPFVNVSVPYPLATPEEVERAIVRPLEESLATIGGVKNIRSTADSRGANVTLRFKQGEDLDEKLLLVKEQVDRVRSRLPSDVRRVLVQKFNTSDQAIMNLRISGEVDLENGYDLLNRYLVQPLERIKGVARVDLQGIEPCELRIILNPLLLERYHIGFNELIAALQDANFALPAGSVKNHTRQVRVVPVGQLHSPDELRNLVLNAAGIRLQDVASVKLVNGDRDYARHLNRSYAIGVDIYKESGANLVEVGDRVMAEIERIGQLPQMRGIKLFFFDNQPEGVTQSLNDLLQAGFLGVFLALAVLYLFLRDMPTTLIVSLSVPVSIAITLGVLYFMGYTLNILTLMGLMLAVGMLVDNAVVVSESIFTRLAAAGDSPRDRRQAIHQGLADVILPVFAGTLTSICVFLPNLFGEQDQISLFLSHVAAAIISAMVISLLMALTVIPLMISRLPNARRLSQGARWVESLKRAYGRWLAFTLHHRYLTAVGIMLIAASAVIPLGGVKVEMFTDSAQRTLWLNYHLDGNYSLERLKKDVDRIESYLFEHQNEFELESVYSYYSENGFATTGIRLKPDEQRHQSVAIIKEKIREGLPAIATGKPAFGWRSRTGGEGMKVYLKGDSTEKLRELLPQVRLALKDIQGIKSVREDVRNPRQELRIILDRDKAMLAGVNPETLARNVSVALRGMNLRDFTTADGEIPVILRFYEKGRFQAEQLLKLPIKTTDGRQVPLETVARVDSHMSAESLQRRNRISTIGISLEADKNSNMGQLRQAIAKKMNTIHFPSGYYWSFGEDFDRDTQTMEKMSRNILIAVALIFIIMAAVFESVLFPVVVVTSIAFSIVGVYWFFYLTGTTFSLMAMIGILILIGVVVNNGIVLIDHIIQLRQQGLSREGAVIQGGKDRLRPILMTVATTVMGLVPLAVSTSTVGGNGGPPYFPMARAIIGGLLFSTFISLLVLPSLYVWLDDLHHWVFQRVNWARSVLIRFTPRASGGKKI